MTDRLAKLEHAAFLLSVLRDEVDDPDWDFNYMFENHAQLLNEIDQTLKELGPISATNYGLKLCVEF